MRIAVAVIPIALALILAPTARADTDSDFLNGLAGVGITYPDRAATIRRGHLVCEALTTGGFTYTETVYGMARMSGSTVAAENAFAAAAIGFYCPNLDRLINPAQDSFPPDARLVLTTPA